MVYPVVELRARRILAPAPVAEVGRQKAYGAVCHCS